MDTKSMVRQTIPLGVEMSTPMIAARIYGKETASNQELKNAHHAMSLEVKWGNARRRTVKVNGRSVTLWVRLQ